jgi:hypothetical protein
MDTPAQIRKIFNDEFQAISSLFCYFELDYKTASATTEKGVAMPGVYVWWHPKLGTLKVGRHLVNARKRALEHITANTGEEMNELAQQKDVRLLLFNVSNEKDIHWVAALEIFLEKNLNPRIASKRTG